MALTSSAVTGSLPPPDVWLINPKEDIVPTHFIGEILDTDRLLADVEATIDPSFVWPPEDNEHHYLWPARFYPMGDNLELTAIKKVRDLSVSKVRLPIMFHDWLHQVTLPPPVLSQQAAEQRLRAWHNTQTLFNIARRAIHKYEKLGGETLDPQDSTVIAPDVIYGMMGREHRRGWSRRVEDLRGMSPEFRIVEFTDDPQQLIRSLGHLLTKDGLLAQTPVYTPQNVRDGSPTEAAVT
jgi:hypothetical protein